MLASWYDEQGPAADVLHVGELPDPEPGPGEVRVRVTVSGVNPGDTKKRLGWLGSSMPYPRVIPHSDAAGVIDEVGDGVDARRVGQRVWTYGAQSYRPFGTAAEYTVVPDHQAVPLPDHLGDELGASLGIPGITAHRLRAAGRRPDALSEHGACHEGRPRTPPVPLHGADPDPLPRGPGPGPTPVACHA
jgi:NADPH2:quinone reductase